MHHPTDRITHTTAFVIPVVEHWLEREIAQWVHYIHLRFQPKFDSAEEIQLLAMITEFIGSS